MNEADEDPAVRARKYITALTAALERTRINENGKNVVGANIHRVLDAIDRYLRDAEHYLNEHRPSTSLASVAYAEGLLDALIFLELTTD